MQEPNLEYLNQLSDGDESFKLNIIKVLKKEFPIEIAVFNNNFEKKNYEETANNIHKIKYKFSLLGLNEDFNLATEFENQIKTGNSKLFKEFEIILQKIDTYIKTI